jgi:hypothetical protein
VRPGETLIGRHETCHIVIDDPLASRRHARLNWELGRLSVEDLGSVNGVLINGRRIEQASEVENGDELRLGGQRIEVVIVGSEATLPRRSMSAKTLSGVVLVAPSPEEDDEATGIRDGEALTTLALVAERVLAMGRGAEAEKILGKPLEAIAARVRRGEAPDPDMVELAAACAVRLAEATHRGAWIDYAIELYAQRRMVLPGVVVDRMYNAVRVVDGANMDRYRQYLDIIRGLQSTLGPSELFLLRRIEGLERLFALK